MILSAHSSMCSLFSLFFSSEKALNHLERFSNRILLSASSIDVNFIVFDFFLSTWKAKFLINDGCETNWKKNTQQNIEFNLTNIENWWFPLIDSFNTKFYVIIAKNIKIHLSSNMLFFSSFVWVFLLFVHSLFNHKTEVIWIRKLNHRLTTAKRKNSNKISIFIPYNF